MCSFHSGCHSAATLDCAYPTLDTRSGLSPVQLVCADSYEYSRFANDVIGVSNIERLTFFLFTFQMPAFVSIFPNQADTPCPRLQTVVDGDMHRTESVVTSNHEQCLAIVQSGSAPALPTGNLLTVLLVIARPATYPPTTGENETMCVDESIANIGF